jgi:hypothetical protein
MRVTEPPDRQDPATGCNEKTGSARANDRRLRLGLPCRAQHEDAHDVIHAAWKRNSLSKFADTLPPPRMPVDPTMPSPPATAATDPIKPTPVGDVVAS